MLRTLVLSAETPSHMTSKIKVRSDAPIVDGSIFILRKRLSFSRHAMLGNSANWTGGSG
jgi:hypothetical protein